MPSNNDEAPDRDTSSGTALAHDAGDAPMANTECSARNTRNCCSSMTKPNQRTVLDSHGADKVLNLCLSSSAQFNVCFWLSPNVNVCACVYVCPVDMIMLRRSADLQTMNCMMSCMLSAIDQNNEALLFLNVPAEFFNVLRISLSGYSHSEL